MPELKHNFTQGKMNKDLDERLIPNGQYRDAINVEVSTSEGSDVGTVQNILGNKRIENLVGTGFKCVGSISDEKTNKLYWFISSYEKDVILEYDAGNDVTSPVLVDLKAGTQKAVLKFFGNIITGINIIDNLLFWTDGKGEPKKINIDICKAGTPNINTHTQISFNNNSFVGIAAEYLWPTYMPDYDDSGMYGTYEDVHTLDVPFENRIQVGKYVVFERRRFANMLGYSLEELTDDYGQIMDANNQTVDNSTSHGAPGNFNSAGVNVPGDGYVFRGRHYRDGKLIGVKWMKAWDNEHGTHIRYNYPDSSSDTDFKYGDVIFGVDIKKDIEEKHVTVIRPKPLKAPTVKINYQETPQFASKIPNLFEEKFPRFSYRYKYRDGEYSVFAPFTNPVFNPQYTKDTTTSKDGNVLYNEDTSYTIDNPSNKAMVNSIHSIDLYDFITKDTPEDIVEIDILYKQENTPIVYSIGTIKHTDFEWHASLNSEGKHPITHGVKRYYGNFNTGASGDGTKDWMPAADGNHNSGRYRVTTENIYAAVPANQLLRPWDNVPRKAKSQEVSGSRLIYGNYTQNYTVSSEPKVFLEYSDRKQSINSFDTKGLPSIKSQRNYQLGVVYCDEFGRETPIFTSNSGALSVPWYNAGGSKNASKSNQLVASINNDFPDWVNSIKFFIKENSGEYYNLVMQRAWTGKSTYELDNSEGHLWISFPSTDRNKITEDDYIILKKKIGVNEDQISFENKFKIIDIKNEPPEALKYELVHLGHAKNDSNNNFTLNDTNSVTHDALFPANWEGQRPDKPNQDTINLDISRWMEDTALPDGGYRDDIISKEDGSDNVEAKKLYVSWAREDSNGVFTHSSRYKVIGGWRGNLGYVLKLNRNIKEVDADIAHVNGKSIDEPNETHLHPNLVFYIERKELKEEEDFSGQFFVKISKNHITDVIETGNEITNLDKFQLKHSYGAWYWQDDINGGTDHVWNNSGAPYGMTNYSGYNQQRGASNDQQRAGSGHNNTNANGGTLRLTDWHVVWETILATLNGVTAAPAPRFFVDAVHMAGGQSDESNYAKYNCVTWSGSTNPGGGVGSVVTNGLFGWGNNNVSQSSAWIYPPVKKWWSDVSKDSVEATGVGNNSMLFMPNNTNEVITTSQLFDKNKEWTVDDDGDNVGLRIDGWVGPLQDVSRHVDASNIGGNHINGLEGFVTTNSNHTVGPRRWVSGMNGEDYGAGADTKTYSVDGEEGKHFMHLSFFAPGKDLHDNTWELDNPVLYGNNSFMDNLQGIWGGGVFTGRLPNEKFGTETDADDKHFHFAMEGNYAPGEDKDFKALEEPPGPGVGYGYDERYRELHERQWDPTFTDQGDSDNRIRDFIRNLRPGAQFRFNHLARGTAGTTPEGPDDAVFTIKKVQVKKLYNHTNWRNAFNIYGGNTSPMSFSGYKPNTTGTDIGNAEYRSVEQCALHYLTNSIDENGDDSSIDNASATSYGNTTLENLKKKIVDFGSAHNRRLCFIIELDKNPTDGHGSVMGNPLDSNVNGVDNMCADLDAYNFCDLEFLDPVQDMLLSDLNKYPAIWESSPKKQDVDLDIYFEASDNIPIVINRHTNELFAPKGCLVEMINPPVSIGSDNVYLVEWKNNVATFEPGFLKDDGSNEIDYSNIKFKFIRRDGSYTIAETGQQQLTANLGGFKTNFIFKQKINDDNIKVGLNWYNCFSFGNGLESNRILDDFNKMFITNGVKASSTIQETYEEEHRKHGLIFSGLYNSNSGLNDLNQFIQAEKITKDLNPTYGSIQKLFSRDSDLVVFCEDKVLKVLANKDAVFNADSNPQLVANQNVLGQTVPFVGEYGISKNPESFCSESYRAYFTDKQRGAVLRLSKDGLTPISKAGMHDWFRDNLYLYTSIIGTYDSYKENYNITLCNTYTENIIFNTYFQLGSESQPLDASVLSIIETIVGSQYEASWESKNILTNSEYQPITPPDALFRDNITVINHPYIPRGWYQQEETGTGEPPTEVIATENTINVGASDFEFAEYATCDGSTWNGNGSGEQLPNDGWYYDPDFNDYTTGASSSYIPPGSNTDGDLFRGGSSNPDNLWNDYDNNKWSNIRRKVYGTQILESGGDYGPHGWFAYNNAGYLHNLPDGFTRATGNSNNSYDPRIEKKCRFYFGTGLADTSVGGVAQHSQCITRGQDTKTIVFDRCYPDGNGTYVEFDNIGVTQSPFINGVYDSTHLHGELLDHYEGVTGGSYYEGHSTMYNGDELHIQVKIKCYPTLGPADTTTSTTRQRKGYNIIKPVIEIVDGDFGLVSSNYLTNISWDVSQYNNTSDNPYTHVRSTPSGGGNTAGLGSDFQDEGQSANYDTGGTHSDYYCVKPGFQTSPTVEFPSTKLIPDLYYDDTSSSPSTQGVTITIGCSFKFRYNFYQNSDGTWNNSGSSGGIAEMAVVNNLAIRVYNNHVDGRTDGEGLYAWNPQGTNTSNNYPLSHPIWEIRDMHVKKGFGIWEPHSDYVAGTPTTYYDDPTTTGYDEAWTLAQMQAAVPGAWQSSAGWVLNQDDIDAWNNANPGGIVYPQPAIPDADVDAWVQVSHDSRNWMAGMNSTTSGLSDGQWYQSQIAAYFGNDRNVGTAHSEYKTDQTTGNVSTDPADEVVWYTKGADPGGQTPQEGNHGNGTYVEIFNGQSVTSPTFTKQVTDAEGNQHNPPNTPSAGPQYSNGSITESKTYTGFSSGYWRFQSAAGTSGGYGLQQNHTTHYQQDEWYMVDIELDENQHPGTLSYNSGVPPTVGAGSLDGAAAITGAGDMVTFSNWQNLSSIGGTGMVFNGDLIMQPHWRTTYTNWPTYQSKWVLRGVFKATADTGIIANGNTDHTNIRFYNFENNPIYVHKIIVREVSYTNNTGGANGWIRGINDGSGDRHMQINTFTNSFIYFHNNRLCWDNVVRQNNYPWYPNQDFEDIWTKDLSANPVLNVGSGWILKFKVDANSKTGLLNDIPQVRVSGNAVDYATTAGGNGTEYTGINVSGITDAGDYEVHFTMDGNTTNWEIYNRTLHATDPYAPATLTEIIAGGYGYGSSLGYEDTIMFLGGDQNTGTSAAISNIFLTQTETIFSGGQAGSWDFDGFDSTTEQFVTWDIYWDQNGIADGRIQFSNAPTFDSNFGNGNTIISANQYIDKVINRYERYEISFDFKMEDQDHDTNATFNGQGLFHIYYFNSSGYGFRINRIGDEAFSSVITFSTENAKNWSSPNNIAPVYDDNGNFSHWHFYEIVGIGDGSSNRFDANGDLIPGTEDYAYSEFEINGVEALRDTLVIRRDEADNNTLTCWIDNVSMKRVYPLETSGVNSEKTLSYSEDVNGWTSFKSFIPESGVSLSKKYFTFKDAYLYQHYLPMKLNASSVWEDSTLEEADNYNHFYDHTASPYNESSITAVMNSEPSIVKTFKTLGYEGTQAFVSLPSNVDHITTHNAAAWKSNSNIEGWSCSEIESDLDLGNLQDFIKKEGKWFGYIKGKNSNQVLDSSRLSVQGLGKVQNIMVITQ